MQRRWHPIRIRISRRCEFSLELLVRLWLRWSFRPAELPSRLPRPTVTFATRFSSSVSLPSLAGAQGCALAPGRSAGVVTCT